MFRKPFLAVVLILAAWVVAGCAARVPEEITSKVTFRGNFKTLQGAPDQYIGEYAILGGKIIRVDNQEKSSEMAILQLPLDDDHRPQTDETSQGRFLIRTDSFLDPAIYEPGRLITVSGKIAGGENRMIGAYKYTYPVIRGEQIWTWEEERGGLFPRIHFGVGVGTTF